MKAYVYTQMYALENYHFWYIGKRSFLASALKDIPHETILDVGSGTGGTTAYLSQFGRTVGVERNSLAIKLARTRKVRIIRASAHQIPLLSNTFDLITFCDVLYHKNVKEHKALREAYRLLKPGGSLLVTDCALPWLWSHHDIINEGKYRYTRSQLISLITEAGFTVQYCHYIYTSIFPMMILFRLFAPEGPTLARTSRVNRLLIALLQWEASIPRWIPRTWGSSLLLVAKKPIRQKNSL